MTIILGIDPSLTATGVARWHNGFVTMHTIHTGPHLSLYARIATIMGRLMTNIPPPATRRQEPIMACIEQRLEGASGRGSTSNALDVAEVRGVIKYGLYRRRIAMAEVHPSRLKRYATGRGDAGKGQMLDSAYAMTYAMGWPVPMDHNQADALWLMTAALHHYGMPVKFPDGTDPASRFESLNKTVWPPFNMEEGAP